MKFATDRSVFNLWKLIWWRFNRARLPFGTRNTYYLTHWTRFYKLIQFPASLEKAISWGDTPDITFIYLASRALLNIIILPCPSFFLYLCTPSGLFAIFSGISWKWHLALLYHHILPPTPEANKIREYLIATWNLSRYFCSKRLHFSIFSVSATCNTYTTYFFLIMACMYLENDLKILSKQWLLCNGFEGFYSRLYLNAAKMICSVRDEHFYEITDRQNRRFTIWLWIVK